MEVQIVSYYYLILLTLCGNSLKLVFNCLTASFLSKSKLSLYILPIKCVAFNSGFYKVRLFITCDIMSEHVCAKTVFHCHTFIEIQLGEFPDRSSKRRCFKS